MCKEKQFLIKSNIRSIPLYLKIFFETDAPKLKTSHKHSTATRHEFGIKI